MPDLKWLEAFFSPVSSITEPIQLADERAGGGVGEGGREKSFALRDKAERKYNSALCGAFFCRAAVKQANGDAFRMQDKKTAVSNCTCRRNGLAFVGLDYRGN